MKKIGLMLLGLLLVFTACSNLKNPDDVDGGDARIQTPMAYGQQSESGFVKKPLLDSSFFLRLNEEENEVYLPGNIAVKLLAIHDNRCPKGVQCIHAGYVSVDLEIDFVGEDPYQDTLTKGVKLEPDQKSFVVFYGNTYLTLESVEPAPGFEDSDKPEDQIVTLSVTRHAVE